MLSNALTRTERDNERYGDFKAQSDLKCFVVPSGISDSFNMFEETCGRQFFI